MAMAVNVKWFGARFNARVESELKLRLNQAAQLVETEAKRLMQTSKSGRTYRIASTGQKAITKGGGLRTKTRKMHRASAPGEAPAVISGTLIGSITTEKAKKVYGIGYRARVGTNKLYGLYLELGVKSGGRLIAPRPWLRPALANSQNKIKTIFRRKMII